VTTCGGRVIGTNQIQPALPCWRLAEVGPRITNASAYFDERPLEVQWQIVIGLLHRGQAEQDVMISFGEPHNRGFDEREDGKRAEKLVFLDHSGEAYGLNVTLIDNKVVAWQMPAERILTAEAQQRHLEAMEKRLTEKIAKVEELAIRQHAETVKLFGEVMAKQDSMLAGLTRPPAEHPIQARGSGGGGAPQTQRTQQTQLTGSKTLNINGTTYTDGPDGELGNPCSLTKNTCTSPKYSCVIIGGSSGLCAPRK
jgi:hypothetical protein